MGRIFTVQTAQFDNGELSIGAKDSQSGQRVIVRESCEALQDFGQGVVEHVADRKHSAGRLEPDGSVLVPIVDCP